MASLGTVTRGDTEVVELTIKNADGSARDITTDTLTFTVKWSETSSVPLVQKTEGSGIVKTNAASGLAEVTLDPADLAGLGQPHTLYADVEVTDSTGKVATTLFTLNFVLDITV